MAIDLIIAAVTLLMSGYLVVWCFCPRLRPWIEAPKYQVLTWDQRDPNATHLDLASQHAIQASERGEFNG